MNISQASPMHPGYGGGASTSGHHPTGHQLGGQPPQQGVSSSDAIQVIVNCLMFHYQGDQKETFARSAIEALVRKLKDKRDELDALITAVTTNGARPTKCVTLPRTLDGRLQVAGRKGFPHVMFSRIWRWPHLLSMELKHVASVCQFGFDLNLDSVCINPYHYDRVVDPSFAALSSTSLEKLRSGGLGDDEEEVGDDDPMDVKCSAMSASGSSGGRGHPSSMVHNTQHYRGPQQDPQAPSSASSTTSLLRPLPSSNSMPQSMSSYAAGPHFHPAPVPVPGTGLFPPSTYQLSTGSSTNTYAPGMSAYPGPGLIAAHSLNSVPGMYSGYPHPQHAYHPQATVRESAAPPAYGAMAPSAFWPPGAGNPHHGTSVAAAAAASSAAAWNMMHARGAFQPLASVASSPPNPGVAVTAALLTQQQQQQQQQAQAISQAGPGSHPPVMQPPQQRNLPSLTTHRMPEYWCTIGYFELDQQVGESFKVASQYDKVIVDGYTDPSSPDRFCLGQLSNVHRSEQSEKSRLYIGQGVELQHVGEGDVWIRCLSRCSIFVQSYFLDKEAGRQPGEVVHKIYPGASIKVFNIRQCCEEMYNLSRGTQENIMRQAFAMAGATSTAPMMGSSPPGSGGGPSGAEVGVDDLRRLCILRLSFVKGWGPDYPRSSIKETPCWIEIQLHRPLQLLDEVLQSMSVNSLRPSRQFFPNLPYAQT